MCKNKKNNVAVYVYSKVHAGSARYLTSARNKLANEGACRGPRSTSRDALEYAKKVAYAHIKERDTGFSMQAAVAWKSTYLGNTSVTLGRRMQRSHSIQSADIKRARLRTACVSVLNISKNETRFANSVMRMRKCEVTPRLPTPHSMALSIGF